MHKISRDIVLLEVGEADVSQKQLRIYICIYPVGEAFVSCKRKVRNISRSMNVMQKPEDI